MTRTLVEPPPHLSYSQISDILDCGHKYELKRLYRAPENPSWWLIGGKAVHSTSEEIDKALLEGVILSDIEVSNRFGEALAREMAEARAQEPDESKWQAGNKGKEAREWWVIEGFNMSWAWLNWRLDTNLDVAQLPNGTPAVEVELIYNGYGFPFRLFIDRIMVDRNTGQLVIVDLKTGKNEPRSPYQLAFYRDAAEDMLGMKADWGYYWMARKGTVGLAVDLAPITRDMTGRMAKVARTMIDQGLFIPNITSYCNSCGVRPYCNSMGGDINLLSR